MHDEARFGFEAFDAIFGSEWLNYVTTLDVVRESTRRPGDQRAEGIWVKPHDGVSDRLFDEPAAADEKAARFAHPTGNYETEPALPFPFTVPQFRRFCETCFATLEWKARFVQDDGTLNDPAESEEFARPEDYEVMSDDAVLSDDEIRRRADEDTKPPLPYWRAHEGAWLLLRSYFVARDGEPNGAHALVEKKPSLRATGDCTGVRDKILTSREWPPIARQFAIDYILAHDDKDWGAGSVLDVAKHVAKEFAQRGLEGPRGPFTAENVKRNSLAGIQDEAMKARQTRGKRGK